MNKIEKYFAYRQALIDQYVKGDMSKGEYLRKNFDAVLELRDKPFKHLDSLDKCLFNYQYYNAFAKEAKMGIKAQANAEQREVCSEKVNYYYSKKDSATIKALEILDYKDISAYFIKVRSMYLRGKLFEIVIDAYDMILHSTSAVILNRLRNENIFDEEIKHSEIEYYINDKY